MGKCVESAHKGQQGEGKVFGEIIDANATLAASVKGRSGVIN